MIKMRMVRFLGMALVVVLAMASCSSEQEIRVYSISYPFTASDQGWTGDFADYPVDSAGYNLKASHDILPYSINADLTRKGIRISGNSLNSDLFMFLKRKISGLKPGTTYQILFTVRLASNLPTKKVVGAEATMGEQIFLKVGAATEEPVPAVVNDVYRLNLDIGSLHEDGADMITVGTAAVTSSTKTYTLITRFNNSTHSVVATTDGAGELWLIVGAEAGVSGKTTLYYTQVDVLLNQID